MIVFYTEEDYQKEIERAETTAQKELVLRILEAIGKRKENVCFIYGVKEAAGVDMAIDEVKKVTKFVFKEE